MAENVINNIVGTLQLCKAFVSKFLKKGNSRSFLAFFPFFYGDNVVKAGVNVAKPGLPQGASRRQSLSSLGDS